MTLINCGIYVDDQKFMIQCDECGKWLHGECISLSSSQGLRMEECGEHYLCPLCNPQTRLPIPDVIQSATLQFHTVLLDIVLLRNSHPCSGLTVIPPHWKQ